MKAKKIRTALRQLLSSVFATALLIVGLNLLAPAASAHGAMEHVTGTLVRVGNDVLSVKTTKGATVEVHLDAQTEYVRASQPAKKSELKPGDRVVIHAAKKNGVLVAHEVKLGSSTQTASIKPKQTTNKQTTK